MQHYSKHLATTTRTRPVSSCVLRVVAAYQAARPAACAAPPGFRPCSAAAPAQKSAETDASWPHLAPGWPPAENKQHAYCLAVAGFGCFKEKCYASLVFCGG